MKSISAPMFVAVFLFGASFGAAAQAQSPAPRPVQPAAASDAAEGGVIDPDYARRVAEGLERIIAKQKEGSSFLKEKQEEMKTSLTDYDKAQAYVETELKNLRGLVDELKPENDFVKTLNSVEAKAQELANEFEVSPNEGLKNLAHSAREEKKRAQDLQKKAAALRQDLYAQIDRIEKAKDVIVGARKLKLLKQVNEAAREALEKLLPLYEDTKSFADLVNQMPGVQSYLGH